MRRVLNHLVAIVSTAAAIAAVIPLLASEIVRSWARGHSSWVYAGLVVATLIVFLAVDYTISLNRKYRGLEASIQTVSDHDKRLLHKILSELPVDGELIMWLKTGFFVKRIPTAQIDTIKAVYTQLRLYPVGFDNPQINETYQQFIAAIESFETAVTQWTMYDDGNYDALAVPLRMKERKGGEKRYYDALEEIQESESALVAAYDNFTETCQRHGMNIYDLTSG